MVKRVYLKNHFRSLNIDTVLQYLNAAFRYLANSSEMLQDVSDMIDVFKFYMVRMILTVGR